MKVRKIPGRAGILIPDRARIWARSGLRAQNRRAEKPGLEISRLDPGSKYPGSENRVSKMAGPGGPAQCRSLSHAVNKICFYIKCTFVLFSFEYL